MSPVDRKKIMKVSVGWTEMVYGGNVIADGV